MAIEERIILTADASAATKNINNLSKSIDKLEKSLDNTSKTVKDLDLSNVSNASKTLESLSNSLSKDIPQIINRISSSFVKLNSSLGDFNSAKFDDIRVSISGLSDQISTIQGLGEALNLLNNNLKESQKSAGDTNLEIKQSADNVNSFTVAVKGADTAQKNEQKTIKSLRDDLKRYRDEILNLDEGTKEYQVAIENLTQTQRELATVQNITINGAGDLATIFQNTSRVGTNLAKTFGLAQGALALFGSESEELNKTAVKLLATLNLINGLSGLGSFPKNLEALRASLRNSRIAVLEFNSALLANPVIAVTAAIAALTVGFIALYNNLDSTNKNLNNTKKIVDEAKISQDLYNKSIDQNIELLKAQGKTQSDIRKAELEAANERIKTQRLVLDEITKQLEEELRANRLFNKRRIKQIQEFRQEQIQVLIGFEKDEDELRRKQRLQEIKEETDANKKRLDEQQTQAKKETDLLKKTLSDIESASLSSYEIQFNALTKTYDERRKILVRNNKETLDLEYQYQQQVLKLQQDRDTEELSDLQKRLKIEQDLYDANHTQRLHNIDVESLEIQERLSNLYSALDDIRNENGDETQVLERINEVEYQIAERHANVELLEIERLESLKIRLNEVLELEVLNSMQRIDVESQLQDTINQIEKRSVDYRINQIERENQARQNQANVEKKIKDDRVALQNAYTDAALRGSNAVAEILGKSTVAGKAIAVAGATIDTYRGAAQSLAQPGFPFPLRVANSAATIATGLAAVKNIVSTNIGSAGASTTSIPSISTPNIDYNIPMPDVSDYYDPTQTEAVRQLESTEEREINSRVYVVESDISNSLEYNRARVVEATF